jgi:hypothetical protein
MSTLTKTEALDTAAALAVTPAFRAAETIAKIEKIEPIAVYTKLQAQVAQVQRGDLSVVEAQLAVQLQTLNAIFQAYAQKALSLELHRGGELYMRLALKAQIQATRTAEVLGNLKNAPVVIANQLNMAQNQQVNNHTPANSETVEEPCRARGKQNRLDAGAPGTSGRASAGTGGAAGFLDTRAHCDHLHTRAPRRLRRAHPSASTLESATSTENPGCNRATK